MRTYSFGLVLLLLLVSTAVAQQDDLALVLVQDPPAETVAKLLAAEVMVVRDMQSYLLVAARSGDQVHLEQLGLDWRLLDSTMAGKTYYSVGLRHERQVAWLENQVAVLWSDDHAAVFTATAAEAGMVAAAGLEIARLFLRPIRLAPALKPSAGKRLDEADPLVQDIVDTVSGMAVDGHVQRLQDFVTRYATHDSCQAAADYIMAQFQAAGIDSVFFHEFSTLYKPNVVAVIPGASQPEKVVVIGGHYDSITSNQNNCPGADDNASGTACVLECARVLGGHQFDYTIKLVTFGAEEQGLIGSEAFASDAAAAGEEIVGAVAVDMIGYLAGGDAMDLDIVDNASSQWLRDLVMDVGSLYVPSFPLVDGSLPFGASSDHASFWDNGYDAILFFEDTGNYSPYIHTTSDIVGVSYNAPALAEQCVKVAAGLVATLARPFRVTIAHTPLPDTEDTENPYHVLAEVTAAGSLETDSLLVYYATGDGFTTLPLTPTGGENEFEAFIPAQPAGTFVDYYLFAQDREGNQALHPAGAPSLTHRFFVGGLIVLLAHDFETDQGWSVGAVGDDATTGIWERVDPNGTWENGEPVQPEDDHTPDPGVMCFVTGNAPPGAAQGDNDVDGGKTTLMSPTFDLAGQTHVWVRYYRWYTNHTGNNPHSDTWSVEVSADGGTLWSPLETVTQGETAWVPVQRFLPDFITPTSQVMFRFVASDEGSGSVVEAGVDDFAILVFEAPVTAVEPVPAEPASVVVLGPNVPNPFNPSTTIRFSVPMPGQKVSLRIYDLAGRQIAVLLEDEMVTGERSVRWGGQDDNGRDVATGVYFYRLVAPGEVLTRKLVLMR